MDKKTAILMCAAHLEKGEHCIVFEDNNVFTSATKNYTHYAANHERRTGKKPAFELSPSDLNKEQDQPKDLNEMSLKELKEFAKDNDIALNGARTKDEILAAIEAVCEEAPKEETPETPEA